MNEDSKNQLQSNLDLAASFESQDVSWLAFCYLADEMSADERRRFEIRLQDDQLAREAVANLVGSCQIINAAIATEQKPVSTAEIRSKKNSNSVATPPTMNPLILATLACALLAMVGFYGFNSWGDFAPIARNANPSSENVEPENQQIILAEAWADADWEATLVAFNSTKESENEFDLSDANSEFDSDWIEATMSDIEADSPVDLN